MTVRFRVGSAATSITALAIYAPIAIGSTVVTMPEGLAWTRASTWLIAVGAQIVFTALVLLANVLPSPKARADWLRIAIIAIAGAVRGLLLVWAAGSVTGSAPEVGDYLARAINSTLIAVIALAMLGEIIGGARAFRREYRTLIERELLLQAEARSEQPALDSSVIAQWVGVQGALRATAETSRALLARETPRPEDLQAGADLISDVLAHQVRPISHGLWSAAAHRPPKLRPLLVAWDMLRPWHPPVAVITATYAVIAVIGSVVRAGVFDGVVFAAYCTLTLWLVTSTSAQVGDRFPAARAVGITTLLAAPLLVFGAGYLIGQLILRAPEDVSGSIVAGIVASLTIAGITLLRKVSRERDALLAQLQHRIDEQVLGILAQRTDSPGWERDLGVFVHHSVQSELTALRLLLHEAAQSADRGDQRAVRQAALARIDTLLTLEPPWQATRSGQDVIARVAAAWEGIARVQVNLCEGGSEGQWHLAGQVVEEGVANAIRVGGARNIHVRTSIDDSGALTVCVRDDGSGVAPHEVAGMGSWWLDAIAPGNWVRENVAGVSELCVRLT